MLESVASMSTTHARQMLVRTERRVPTMLTDSGVSVHLVTLASTVTKTSLTAKKTLVLQVLHALILRNDSTASVRSI